MGALEAAGLEFEQLWVCGMARELWPAVSRASAFVPLDLQRRLCMPDSTATSTLEYAARITQRLLVSAPNVTISWPLQQDGEALHPTPLIGPSLRVALDLPTDEIEPLWNELVAAHGQTELLEQDPPPPLPTDRPVRGGASVLNLQAVSPLNAFIEKRLGATQIEAPSLGISARERGNLMHRALEIFYTACPDRATAAALSRDEQHALLAAALHDTLDALPGIGDAFMRKIAAFEFAQQLPRLMAFVDLDLQRPDFRVVAREEKHSVVIGKLQLRLKLDRLDELADGRKLVIDYKTGGVNRQSWNPAKPRDLQLPLYVHSVVPNAVAVAFAQISVHGIQYDGVGVADTDIAGIRSPGSRAVVEVKYQHPRTDAVIQSWEELRDAWAELLPKLAQQFADGDYRLDPRNPASARGQFAVLSRVYDAGIGLYEDDV
jgi:probable DNA repair protein